MTLISSASSISRKSKKPPPSTTFIKRKISSSVPVASASTVGSSNKGLAQSNLSVNCATTSGLMLTTMGLE
eukprot:CAMPEP_0170545954 /NCGR_PEP_ID=MMETSP0211-20121228/4325_1 /TAXON_ID=311385 /ORGANISM="Pseudokeronopsis sp., Strain OXSARD2" /LENGTH=70 /DNA_ID=CAMNT_0010850139 /DNA_START=234 /DNA_END=446 /DNA_ORIENTATION=+